MNRLKRFIPISCLKTLYNSLVEPQLRYGIICWGNSPEANRLKKVQKRSLRILGNARYNAHAEPIFKENFILNLDDLYKIDGAVQAWRSILNRVSKLRIISIEKFHF